MYIHVYTCIYLNMNVYIVVTCIYLCSNQQAQGCHHPNFQGRILARPNVAYHHSDNLPPVQLRALIMNHAARSTIEGPDLQNEVDISAVGKPGLKNKTEQQIDHV